MKLAKEQMVIRMKSGIEKWIDKEQGEKLINLLGTTETKFVEIDGRLINSSGIDGIFYPQDLEDMTRRKNGQWKGQDGKWHNRGEQECICGNILSTRGDKCGYCESGTPGPNGKKRSSGEFEKV